MEVEFCKSSSFYNLGAAIVSICFLHIRWNSNLCCGDIRTKSLLRNDETTGFYPCVGYLTVVKWLRGANLGTFASAPCNASCASCVLSPVMAQSSGHCLEAESILHQTILLDFQTFIEYELSIAEQIVNAA